MTIKELEETGILQEANRLFFHLIGLELRGMDSDNVTILWVEDFDRETSVEDLKLPNPKKEHAVRISELREKLRKARVAKFGWVVQPVK